jgi:hypothetical protein
LRSCSGSQCMIQEPGLGPSAAGVLHCFSNVGSAMKLCRWLNRAPSLHGYGCCSATTGSSTRRSLSPDRTMCCVISVLYPTASQSPTPGRSFPDSRKSLVGALASEKPCLDRIKSNHDQVKCEASWVQPASTRCSKT